MTPVGAPGAPAGRDDGVRRADSGAVAAGLTARTVNVYVVPASRPVIVCPSSAGAVTVCVAVCAVEPMYGVIV